MPDLLVAGLRLHFELVGPNHGRPIVLVHGFASDYELNWVGTRWQETLTGAGWRVIGLDCRGHGHSAKPHDPAAYARAEMAADVVRLLDHLGLERADYLGYSMGARIGLELVLAHPERVRRAVLGGLGVWADHNRAELIARRLRGDETVTDPTAVQFHTFAATRRVNDLEALACCILGPQPPLEPWQLAAVRVPVLVVVGELDPIARGAAEIAERIPGARYVAIPGRDHLNLVPARPFKETTLAFLRAPESSP